MLSNKQLNEENDNFLKTGTETIKLTFGRDDSQTKYLVSS